jgi:hypothetical protein
VLVILWRVKEERDSLPPLCLAKMGLGRKIAQPNSYATIRGAFVSKKKICAPYQDGRNKYNNIELGLTGSAQACRSEPYGHYGKIDRNFGEGGDTVTYTHVDKGMMKVCPVGAEGTLATHYAHGHNTESVCNWDGEESNNHGSGTITLKHG